MKIFTIRMTSWMLKLVRHSRSSNSTAVQAVSSNSCSDSSEKDTIVEKPKKKEYLTSTAKGKLVSKAFKRLVTNSETEELNDSVDRIVSEAKYAKELLSIVSEEKLSKNNALKLISTLPNRIVEAKVQTSHFKKEPRCVQLGNNPMAVDIVNSTKPANNTNPNLDTVLGVTSDVEAAKLICNISLGQMIKVLSTLAFKKRRSTPLLQSLSFHIASSGERLDIKQAADALYAATSLNFHDEVLLNKLCSDLCTCLMENERRAVVGSVITSLGLLRFKHVDLLNLLCEWVQKHVKVCVPQDLSSLVMTLAVLNHDPVNQDTLFPMLEDNLQRTGPPNPQEWLDFVWALTVLNKQTAQQVASVLSTDFIDKMRVISTDNLSIATKLKLLNVNGVAKLRIKDYKGPLLDTSEEWKVPLLRSKEKQALVASVQEKMLNLLPSAIYLNNNVETDMGFMIDAEFMMSANLKPLPLFDRKSQAPINRSDPDHRRGVKVAIFVCDFHDMTRGRRETSGIHLLYQELTILKGYRIMTVDHMDFNPRNELVQLVQYLYRQLKAAVPKNN